MIVGRDTIAGLRPGSTRRHVIPRGLSHVEIFVFIAGITLGMVGSAAIVAMMVLA